MSTLAIKQGRPHHGTETFHLVHRRHDLSGTDYEPLIHIDRSVAIALGTNGVVVRDRDAVAARGRPGVVVDAIVSDEGVLGEIRADVADPTTGMGTFLSDPGLAGQVLGDQRILELQWVGTPPKV